MSKTSKRRPHVITNEEFKRRWENIFGKKPPSTGQGTMDRANEQVHTTKREKL